MTYVLPFHIICMELGSNCNMVVLVQSILCCFSKACDASLDLSNTELMFKDRYHFSTWHSSIAVVGAALWGASSVFPAILNGVHPLANSFIWRSWCPSTFLQHHSRALLFNTMWNCINVIVSVCEELPCSLLWSTAKHQLTSQRHRCFATAAIVPLAPHTICVQSYETLYGSATIHILWSDLCTYIYRHTHIHTHTFLRTYICIYIRRNTCMWMYVHCVHTYMHAHVRAHIHVCT